MLRLEVKERLSHLAANSQAGLRVARAQLLRARGVRAPGGAPPGIPRDTFTQHAAAPVEPSVGLECAGGRLHVGGRRVWLWGHAAWKQSRNLPAPAIGRV